MNTRNRKRKEHYEKKMTDSVKSDLFFKVAYQNPTRPTARRADPYSAYFLLWKSQLNGKITRAQISNISCKFLPTKMNRVLSIDGCNFCGIYSNDAEYFIHASKDARIFVRDPKNDYKLQKLIYARNISWSIMDVDVSPDCRHLIYSSWSPSVHIVSIDNEHDEDRPLDFQPDNRGFSLFSIKFSHDGMQVFGGSNDKHLYLYDIPQQKRTMKIYAHEDDVNSVAFSQDSSFILFSAGDDGLCKVWDTRCLNGKPVGVLCGHSQGITHISTKSDGRYIITNSKDQSIKLWDIRSMASGEQPVFFPGTNFDYRYPDEHPRPRQISVPEDKSIQTFTGHHVQRTLIRSRFSPVHLTGERFIYSGCHSGAVRIWDVLTGKPLAIHQEDSLKHLNLIRDVSWHPFENVIISSSWDGSIGFWSSLEPTDEEVQAIREHMWVEDRLFW